MDGIYFPLRTLNHRFKSSVNRMQRVPDHTPYNSNGMHLAGFTANSARNFLGAIPPLALFWDDDPANKIRQHPR
jgi:hypothetical protein